MEKYNFIFVVLTYRNPSDLEDFFHSVNNKVKFNYKIIVVNSYCDDSSSEIIKQISLDNECDFLEVENNGYGCGNNAGIRYAREKYKFDFLIISNPDILIENFDFNFDFHSEEHVIAPDIYTSTGKKQNPYYHFDLFFIERLKFYGFAYNRKISLSIAHATNRLIREFMFFFYRLIKKNYYPIYAPHGAFMIIPFTLIEQLGDLFDEDMFLFNEEAYLARKLKSRQARVIYDNTLKIHHKEDGSIGDKGTAVANWIKESFLIYYNKSYKQSISSHRSAHN